MTLATADHRPLRYLEPDPQRVDAERVVYRASSLGSCDRAVLLTALGVTPAPDPPGWQQVLDEGTIAESAIRLMWEEQKAIEVVDDQLEVQLDVGVMNDRNVIIRGHIDGRWHGDPREPGIDGGGLWESKKFRESTFPDFLRDGIEVHKNYPWQLSVYMHALGLDYAEVTGGLLVGYRDRITGKLHDSAFEYDEWSPKASPDRIPEISKIVVKPVHGAPIPMHAIIKRIIMLERMIAKQPDPASIECVRSWPCGYYPYHDPKPEPETFVLDADPAVGSVMRKLTGAIKRKAELNAEVARLDKIARAEADKLRLILTDKGGKAEAADRLVYGSMVVIRDRGVVKPESKPRGGYTKDSFKVPKPTKEK